ncbi:MAG: HipA domain-containing protein [Chlorobiales bacterium]|nr:HipA domain-containing protein [Chlorobiales bacterium]
MEQHCLFCYKPLDQIGGDYHPRCSTKMFGTATPPLLPYDESQLDELALEVIRSQITITGVQPKLSLHLTQDGQSRNPQRFTIVGLWGGYILKPPSEIYPQLPEIEDLTMHLAEAVRIHTVPHCLIRMQSGNLAYLTRRIDRSKNGKIHMEDMCQITERLTEDKYRGSYEQIAKAIRRHSVNPGLDVINFFEMVLFCFLTGNADMHLKNFSLIDIPEKGGISLAPAYDMVATALVNPADTEDVALTLNGKKKRITLTDFKKAFGTLSVDEKVQTSMFMKFKKVIPVWNSSIDNSFLDNKMKAVYKQLILKKFHQLNLI